MDTRQRGRQASAPRGRSPDGTETRSLPTDNNEWEPQLQMENTRIDVNEKPPTQGSQAFHTCRLQQTNCNNMEPVCTACLQLRANCVYRDINSSTFEPSILAIPWRKCDSQNSIQPKSTELPPPINLLGTGSTPIPNSQRDLGSWSGRNSPLTYCTRYLINTDAVLKWPIFGKQGSSSQFYPVSPIVKDNNTLAMKGLLMEVDFSKSEILLETFFDNVYIFDPIMDEEDIREYVKTTNGIGWDAKSCRLLLIYAHASILMPLVEKMNGISPPTFHDSAAFQQAESYFLAAEIRMGPLLCQSGFIEAQCFFLAGTYLMATLRPVEARKMFIQALACCQTFSIHEATVASRSEGKDGHEQYIYWTCFKSELEIRLELNLLEENAPSFNCPDFFSYLPDKIKSKKEATWSFYEAENSLQKLRSQVLKYAYKADKTHNLQKHKAIYDFEEQLGTWLHCLPEMLLFHSPRPRNQQEEALSFILNSHFLDCQEVIYWQSIVDIIQGQPFDENDQVYLHKGLKVCVDRIQQNQKGIFCRHYDTWLMLRSCTRSAFVLLAATQHADLRVLLPAGWKKAVLDVTKMLRYWKDESKDIYELLTALTMYVKHWLP